MQNSINCVQRANEIMYTYFLTYNICKEIYN